VHAVLLRPLLLRLDTAELRREIHFVAGIQQRASC
jgi:hypothetical protein